MINTDSGLPTYSETEGERFEARLGAMAPTKAEVVNWAVK